MRPAPPSPVAGATQAKIDELLERVASSFEGALWTSEIGDSIRGWLSRWDIRDETLRSFGVGYAPGDTRWLFDRLDGLDFDPSDLLTAGLASRSARGRLHAWFHGRLMFPVREPDGRLLGFAGLATHLGPSWPLWLTSPSHGPFDPARAIFGIDHASSAIAVAQRALVVRDCVELLALHQQGRKETVAVVQNPISRQHLGRLAATIGAEEVHLSRRDGRLGVVAAPPGTKIGDDTFASRSTPNGLVLIHSNRKPKQPKPARRDGPTESDADLAAHTPTRALVFLASGLIGAGLPIGLLLLASSGNGPGGSTTALNVVLVGVATFYLLLAFGVSRVSARHRERSRTRRMREPWARGSSEWQPAGWTYHRLEEILVGAALASAVICVVLLMTIGGFLG